MRRRLALIVLLTATWILVAPVHAEEEAPRTRAFVSFDRTPRTAFVGQPVRIVLRVGFDRAFFEAQAVPLFRRAIDVPVQVKTMLAEALPGAARVAPAKSETRTLALDDAVVEARVEGDEVVNGRPFAVLEIAWRWQPTAAGEFVVPAPRLRYAWATRFEEDFLGDRVAVDRRDETIEGDALALRVVSLPEEGRPEGFIDAVGRFEIAARLLPQTAGSHMLRLELVLVGDGNVETLEGPPAERFEGFHVYGVLDDAAPGRRTLTYDLAPLADDVKAVPSVAFAYFDPHPPAGYREIRTAPLPLPVPEEAPADAAETDDPAARIRAWMWRLVGFAGVVILVLAILGVRGARRRPTDDALRELDRRRRRIDAAAEPLRRAIDAASPEVEDALVAYLAARLDCPEAAVVTPDLPARLEARGVPASLARETAEALERLVAARYGGAAVDMRVDPAILTAWR